MSATQPPIDPWELTVRQLLATWFAVLNELLRRGLVRTRNSALGDVAESLTLRAYGGELAPNPDKSYDPRRPDGRRVHVKARFVDPLDRRIQAISAFRSWN